MENSRYVEQREKGYVGAVKTSFTISMKWFETFVWAYSVGIWEEMFCARPKIIDDYRAFDVDRTWRQK